MQLPSEFDHSVNMVAHAEENGIFHSVVRSAALAEALVREGSPADLETAEKVIASVLSCQVTEPEDQHFGNFLWELESEVVEDLNAVQFVLFRFIPLLIEFPDRLSAGATRTIRNAIRVGLDAISRIDVHLLYTNIVLKDICNSCLGGELLGDSNKAERGYAKMQAWFDRTRRSGIPTEYNSPPYTSLAIEVLGGLAATTTHDQTKALATLAAARLAVSAALRINPETGRWAGPFGRAYRETVLADDPPETERLEELIEAGLAPEWVRDVMHRRTGPHDVLETSDIDTETVVSTHHSRSFSLGVASRELSTQSNRFIAMQSQAFDLRYAAPKLGRVATVTTRYLQDHMWLGKFQTTPSRAWDQVFPEEGSLRGVQRGPSAIVVGIPRMLGAQQPHSRACLTIIWTAAESVEGIYIDGDRVSDLPVDIPVISDLCVVTENLLVGIRLLGRTALGPHAPVRLVERGGMIALEMHNYLGPKKTFWELAQPGAFFHGLPYCAFYIEVVERDQWEGAQQFITALSSGESSADVTETKDLGDTGQRCLTATYSRSGQAVGLEVDLVTGELVRRFTEKGNLDLPKHRSNLAVHSDSSPIEIGNARLDFGSGDAWLVAMPDSGLWVVGFTSDSPSDVILTTEHGQKRFPDMSAGLLVCRSDDFHR